MKWIILAIVSLTMAYSEETIASEWRTKPVQCGSIEEIQNLVYEMGEEFLLRADGFAFDLNKDPFSVTVGLWANLETGTYTIVETDGREICVLSFGNNLDFDLIEMEDRHPRGIDPKKDTRT